MKHAEGDTNMLVSINPLKLKPIFSAELQNVNACGTLYNKNQGHGIFEVPNQEWCKCRAGIIMPLILYLGMCIHMLLWIPMVTYAKSQFSTQQCIWGKTWISVNAFPSHETKPKVKRHTFLNCLHSLAGRVVWKGTSVDVKIKLISSSLTSMLYCDSQCRQIILFAE